MLGQRGSGFAVEGGLGGPTCDALGLGAIEGLGVGGSNVRAPSGRSNLGGPPYAGTGLLSILVPASGGGGAPYTSPFDRQPIPSATPPKTRAARVAPDRSGLTPSGKSARSPQKGQASVARAARANGERHSVILRHGAGRVPRSSSRDGDGVFGRRERFQKRAVRAATSSEGNISVEVGRAESHEQPIGALFRADTA